LNILLARTNPIPRVLASLVKSFISMPSITGGEMRHGDALWLCTRDGVGDSFKLMLMVEPTPGLAVADPPSKGISVGLTLSV